MIKVIIQDFKKVLNMSQHSICLYLYSEEILNEKLIIDFTIYPPAGVSVFLTFPKMTCDYPPVTTHSD